MILGNPADRLRRRVTGAKLLGLVYPVQRFVRESLLDEFATMPVDDIACVCAQLAGHFEDVAEHRPASKGLQHLGQVRLHALALARREDNGAQRHEEFNSRMTAAES